MDPKALTRLVEQAKEDPEFFHNLVFDPENTLKELDYLDREQKAALISISPEQIIGTMIGVEYSDCVGTCHGPTCACTTGSTGCGHGTIACGDTFFAIQPRINCGPQYTCSCTTGTCGGVTCGGSTCDVTCSGDSCGHTCGNSCGWTTNLQVIDPIAIGQR